MMHNKNSRGVRTKAAAIVWLFACVTALLSVNVSIAQNMYYINAIPIYGWGNSDMGGAAYSGEVKGQFGPIGFKAGYARGYTSESDARHFYKYLDELRLHAAWRFADKDEGDLEIGHLLTVGYTNNNFYKHHLFKAVDPTLRPPSYNPDESQRLLSEYYTNMKVTTGYLSIGYERIKVHDFAYAGFFTHFLLNPWGVVVGKFTDYESGEMLYTAAVYADLLIMPPQGCSYSVKDYYSFNGETPVAENMVTETMYQNKVGFRMGYEVTTLGALGLSFGVETGIIPGISHQSSDYGNGFPQDNIYFGMKAGLAIGHGGK